MNHGVPEFVCTNCGSLVKSYCNHRFEPVSGYWHGLNIEEVFCSPRCALIRHTERNNNIHLNLEFLNDTNK